MFTKANLIRNGVPSLVAFIILYLLGDRFVLPAVFSATDATMLLATIYGTRWALFKFGFIENWLGK